MDALTLATEVVAPQGLVFPISFALYTLGIIAVGLYSARFARKTDEDYFLAGRSLGPWVAALSAGASSESGWVTLGLVGLAFANGVQAYWILPGTLIGIAVNWFIIAPRLRDRAAEVGAVTIPDFFSFSFRERIPLLRILTVIVILSSMFLYVAAQIAAAGEAFSSSFSGLNYFGGVLLGAGIVLAYTVVGGFRAACWTDFVQALVMVGALAIFPIFLIAHHGGIGFITENLASVNNAGGGALLSMNPEKSGLALIGFLLGSGALGINFGFVGIPHAHVRFMALRDRREYIMGGTICVIWSTLIFLGAVTIGVAVRAMAEGGTDWAEPMLGAAALQSEGEKSLMIAATNMLPGFVSGLMLAAVLSAMASTADSQLIVAASAAANDLYARLIDRKGKISHGVVNRIVVLGLGIGAVIAVMDREREIYSFVLEYGWAMLGGAFGPQMLLLLLWKRATYAGCLAGMVVGFTLAISWKHIYHPEDFGGVEIYNLTVAFVAAGVTNIIVSLCTTQRAVYWDSAADDR